MHGPKSQKANMHKARYDYSNNIRSLTKTLKKRSSVNADKLVNARKRCGLGNSPSSTDSPTAVKAHRHHDRGRDRRRLQRQPCPCLSLRAAQEKDANLKTEYVRNGGQVVTKLF